MPVYTTTEPPVLTVDIKRSRIRIHKKTYHLLDSPAYCRFLINPEKKAIVVELCDASTPGAVKLPKLASDHSSVEVHSKSLISELVVCAGYENYTSVRLFGHFFPEQNAVFFRMDAGNQAVQA